MISAANDGDGKDADQKCGFRSRRRADASAQCAGIKPDKGSAKGQNKGAGEQPDEQEDDLGGSRILLHKLVFSGSHRLARDDAYCRGEAGDHDERQRTHGICDGHRRGDAGVEELPEDDRINHGVHAPHDLARDERQAIPDKITQKSPV